MKNKETIMSITHSENSKQKGIQSHIYQQISKHSNTDMPSNIQQILPALSQLTDTNYNYLYNLLAQFDNNNNSIATEKNISRLGNGYFGKVAISDDFTDELDDEIWGF